MIKHSRGELEAMPLKVLRNLDISTPDEERMIQDIILSKSVLSQPVVKFNTKLVPDIKSPEDEKVWQDKIDKFNDEHTPVEAKIAEAEKVLEKTVEEIAVEMPKDTSDLVTPTVVTVKDGKIIKPFCDKCDSKGVRHKKNCPNIKQNADISSETV